MGGDFNGKHLLWCNHAKVPNGAGYKFQECISLCDLTILNEGSPTCSSGDLLSRSAIDLILTSSSLASIAEWKALGNSHGSDHHPVEVQFFLSSPAKSLCRPHYITSKINWTTFSSEMLLAALPDHSLRPEDIESLISLMKIS